LFHILIFVCLGSAGNGTDCRACFCANARQYGAGCGTFGRPTYGASFLLTSPALADVAAHTANGSRMLRVKTRAVLLMFIMSTPTIYA
jgi:hypothetical protein